VAGSWTFGWKRAEILSAAGSGITLLVVSGIVTVEAVTRLIWPPALLVNVGCHADAHEQARWFGDDIALKSGKYMHELGGFRAMLATMRLVGAGNPPLHRFRVDLSSPSRGTGSWTG
jgi:hypothetical protein